jgi:hypothetical protein
VPVILSIDGTVQPFLISLPRTDIVAISTYFGKKKKKKYKQTQQQNNTEIVPF